MRDVNVDHNLGARPAFNLNLSSVLFSSRIQPYQYKLTLADSNRTIGIRAAITRDSATQITVPYTKDSGSNHVSLLITNKDDAWTAGSGWSTGAVKQDYATAAVSETNGTITLTLPDNYETNKGNWQVWLLAEKVNGEHETDCASAPVAITVPAYMPKVAYVDAKGNTPANSPVACTPVTASDTTWGADGQTTWYAVTGSVTITSRVEVKGNVNLILCDGSTLTAEKGITVSGDNNSLTIWAQSGGTGKLYAGTTDGTDSTCPDESAGIGGGYERAGGKVTINSGTVNATGGVDGAGIGGGYYGAGGEVTVTGGTVYATGGFNGAGIGGGDHGAGGEVTVTGGTVNATGGDFGAGIGGGGGCDYAAGGEVTVTGGTVNATGGYSGAGISGGYYGDGGTVTINGGTVYAQANGSSAQAIGHGDENSTAGSLEIYAGAKVSAGEDDSSASLVQDGTARVDACRDNQYAAIEPCENHSYTKYKNITDTTHTPVCAYCLNEGTATAHAFVNHKCVCGKEQQKATVTTRPTARSWVDNGNAQALAEAGAASGGTMVYAVTTTTAAPDAAAYSEAIPTEKEIGKYYVWYKAQGNGNYADSDAAYVTARIYFPVTFKVVGGTWTDGTTEKTLDVSRLENEDLALTLRDSDIPQGTPDSSHTSAGTWDEDPNEYVNNRTITSAKTFTLTFPEKTLATVTTAPDAVNPTYNGSAQALVTAGAAEGGRMYYALGANETTAPTDGWSTDIPTGTNAETYYVWYKAQGDAAHLDTEPKRVQAGITPKSITGATVTLDKTQLGYTSAEQTVTVTGVTIDGLTLTENDYDVTGNTGTNAADYTVTVTGKGNFQDTATAEWKIVEVGMTLSAPDVSATYDGQPHGIAVTVSEPAGAVIKFKDEAGAYTLDASPAITNAGSLVVGYQITADNYLPVTGSATVTVTPKAATVTASAQTVKEGESIQTGTDFATLTDALSGHTLSAVTLTAENGKIVPADAKIQDAAGNDVTGNYTLSYQPGALTALGKISHTVTFKVVNGSWDDGTNADKTATLTGFAGDTLKLAAADIPAVGTKPGDAFKAGAWDVTPSADAEITADKTYTYTYALRDAYLVTITNDGNGTGSASPNSGYEGTEVLLTAAPKEGYKLKEWQVVSGGVTIEDNKFKLGAANVEVKAVFEAQATGWHKGETQTQPGAPEIQCGNMQQVVESIIAAIQKGEMKGISEEVRQAVSQPGAQVLVLFISAPISMDQIPAEDRAALEQLQKDAGYTGIVPFDITLKLNVNGRDVAEVHETKIPVKFSVCIMENLLGTPRTFSLVNVHNGAAKVLPTTRRGNFLDGESSEFSTYAIAYKDEETPTDTPAPTSTPAPVIAPDKFDDVAVPSDSFAFKKVWQGDSEKSIDFTLYKIDGSVYHHGFDKKVVSDQEWQYNAWFSEPAACYVIEKPIPGYQTKYVNVGVYAQVTDRCCDGGTIINKKIPKTGDEEPLLLWAGMIALGVIGLGTALVIGKKRKAHK